MFVMNMGEPPSLLRNELKSDRHWIGIQLEGTQSNRSAIGASVTVEDEIRRQTQPVLSQSSFVSQNNSVSLWIGRSEKRKKYSRCMAQQCQREFRRLELDRIVHLREASSPMIATFILCLFF